MGWRPPPTRRSRPSIAAMFEVWLSSPLPAPWQCRKPTDRRRGATVGGSNPAEPVVALLLPVAGIPVVDHGHFHHVLRILEAELGRDANLHRETVLARQDRAVELERHLGLRVQRSGHVDRGGIALGAAEPD